MPVQSPVDAMHASNPAYQVATAQAVAAGATFLTPAVDCGAFAQAAVFVSIDTSHAVVLQASLDEATWFTYVPHVDTPAQSQYTGATAFNTVRRVELAGARFLRVSVYNSSAAAAVLNAWITLQGPS